MQRKLQRARGRAELDARSARLQADLAHVLVLLEEHQLRISRLEGQARRVDGDLTPAWELFEAQRADRPSCPAGRDGSG